MKKFELNVVNFDNEDVISTSVYLTVQEHNVPGAGVHWDLYCDGARVEELAGVEIDGEYGFEFVVLEDGTGCYYKLRGGESETAIDANHDNTIADFNGLEGYYEVSTQWSNKYRKNRTVFTKIN